MISSLSIVDNLSFKNWLSSFFGLNNNLSNSLWAAASSLAFLIGASFNSFRNSGLVAGEDGTILSAKGLTNFDETEEPSPEGNAVVSSFF